MKKIILLFFLIFFLLSCNNGIVFSQENDLLLQGSEDDKIVSKITPETDEIVAKADGAWFIIAEDKKEFKNLAKDSRFVFKNKELVEASFSATEEGYYELGGYRFKLPKGGSARFKKNSDGKNELVITVTQDYRIEQPTITDSESSNTQAYMESQTNSLKLPNQDIMTIPGTSDKKARLGFDKNGFFSEEPFSTKNGIDVGTIMKSKTKKTYLLFDEAKIDETERNIGSDCFIYLGNSINGFKIVTGTSSLDGPSIRFNQGTNYAGLEIKSPDEMLIIKPMGSKTRTRIELASRSNEQNIPLLKAKGYFSTVLDSHFFTYDYEDGRIAGGPIGKVNFDGTILDFSSKNPIPLEIDIKDSSGNLVNYPIEMNGQKKEINFNYNIISTKKVIRIESINEMMQKYRSISFQTMMQKINDAKIEEKFLSLPNDLQIELLGKTSDEIRNFISMQSIQTKGIRSIELKNPPQSKEQLERLKHVAKKIYNLGSQYDDNDPVTTAHETTHGINNAIRNNNGLTGNVNGFYFPEQPDKFYLIDEPKLKLSDVAKNCPQNLRSTGFYRLYLIDQQKYWNNEPSYVLDELTAYTNGGIIALEGNYRDSINIPEAMTASITLAMTIKEKDNNYWNSNSGEGFRQFLRISLERAMDTHIRQSIRSGKTSVQAINEFDHLNDPRTKAALIDLYGPEWNNRLLRM